MIQTPQPGLDWAFTTARKFSSSNPGAGTILDELREGSWHKLIFRRWKIVYTLRGDAIIIGRVWPAAMGEADMETPL